MKDLQIIPNNNTTFSNAAKTIENAESEMTQHKNKKTNPNDNPIHGIVFYIYIYLKF